LERSELVARLCGILGEENVLNSEEDLYVYGFDAAQGWEMPWVVVRPKNNLDVARVLEFADENVIPVVPRGNGSSLTGAVVPIRGGIMVDMTSMRGIEVKVDDGLVEAEAGATIDEVDKECRRYGFFFPPDPASSEVATVGGAVSEDSGGMRGARYGTVKDWLLAAEVALPGGKLIWFGSPTYKWRGTYDFLSLFCGSEGTLGIITKAVLKIAPLPERIARVLAFFGDLESAAMAVYEIRRRGFNPLLLEFLDGDTLTMVNEAYSLDLPDAEAAVMADFDGPAEAMDRIAGEVSNVLKRSGAFRVDTSTDPEVIERLYAARKGCYSAVTRRYPKVIIEDIVVPLSKLVEAVKTIRKLKEKYRLQIITFGHAGDGNIHPTICLDSDNGEEAERAEKLFYEIAETAIRLGGSVSAEHGIGVQKVGLLKMELARKGCLESLEYMRMVKRIFDPNGIMNPGKLGL
jgi:glycolate oxidase